MVMVVVINGEIGLKCWRRTANSLTFLSVLLLFVHDDDLLLIRGQQRPRTSNKRGYDIYSVIDVTSSPGSMTMKSRRRK